MILKSWQDDVNWAIIELKQWTRSSVDFKGRIIIKLNFVNGLIEWHKRSRYPSNFLTALTRRRWWLVSILSFILPLNKLNCSISPSITSPVISNFLTGLTSFRDCMIKHLSLYLVSLCSGFPSCLYFYWSVLIPRFDSKYVDNNFHFCQEQESIISLLNVEHNHKAQRCTIYN